jgi:molybdopterin-biosynthesis enzyme MoeA-like protein
MPSEAPPAGGSLSFGLIVIGDEVLNGSRVDSHFAYFKSLLASRGYDLAWFRILPDDPDVLPDELGFTMSKNTPVFVCGGIGATSDDHTRACAAAAAGVPLARHPQAKSLIEGRFGADAYPSRILMADLPQGCGLVPNPFNQIPGFYLRGHFFLPGFPRMAWPMAERVLAEHFPGGADPLQELAVRVLGVPESRLVPLMQRLGPRFPALKLFSLPHIGDDPHVLLGFRGRGEVREALDRLRAELDLEGIQWEETQR